MAMREHHWCGLARYPGKVEFLLGTVQADSYHEAEAKLWALCDALFPARPEYCRPLRGELVFNGPAHG
jgi:hypothetical protein